MTETLIRLEGVGLAYRRTLNPFSEKTWILRDVTFDLQQGEVLGVIGRNGAGKSTLLRLLANIINPDRGQIFRQKKKRSQLLTLNLGFIEKLSGIDNIVLSLVTQGLSVSAARDLVPKILEFGEISHLAKHSVNTYSNGEKARLGFSIAMHANPDVLLLDELFGVGDQKFRVKSSNALKDWVLSNQTVVLVSHSTKTLEECSNRVLWLENGEVQQIGPSKEVLNHYLQAQALG